MYYTTCFSFDLYGLNIKCLALDMFTYHIHLYTNSIHTYVHLQRQFTCTYLQFVYIIDLYIHVILSNESRITLVGSIPLCHCFSDAHYVIITPYVYSWLRCFDVIMSLSRHAWAISRRVLLCILRVQGLTIITMHTTPACVMSRDNCRGELRQFDGRKLKRITEHNKHNSLV